MRELGTKKREDGNNAVDDNPNDELVVPVDLPGFGPIEAAQHGIAIHLEEDQHSSPYEHEDRRHQVCEEPGNETLFGPRVGREWPLGGMLGRSWGTVNWLRDYGWTTGTLQLDCSELNNLCVVLESNG
jgi:hypothetical protein